MWYLGRVGGRGMMRVTHKRILSLVAVVVLLGLQAAPSFATSDDRSREIAKDCSQPLTGFVPLTDLAGGTYKGAEGGLYPGSTNEMPADHATLGMWYASQVEPLGVDGLPVSDGKIVLVSIGVSNTYREFAPFMSAAEGVVAPDVVLVNGAQGGKPISTWLNVDDKTWDVVDEELSQADVTPEQVQVAWVKIPERISSIEELEPFPVDAETYQEDLAQVLRVAKMRYPNLRLAFLTSRIYAGYGTTIDPNPEPLAYQNGFGVKWTIQRQIEGDLELNADPRRGEVNAPWVGWGPYIWADGTSPRSDGLVWNCNDIRDDGVHPTPRGGKKVAQMLLDHFSTDPLAAPWFLPGGSAISAFDLPPLPEGEATTTTVESASATTSTTIAETSTTDRTGRSEERDKGKQERQEQGQGQEQAQERSPDSNALDSSLILGATVLILALVLGATAFFGWSRSRRENRS
jgi:hypothetical protein